MEFPHLGRYCSEKTCKKLDYLPIECNGCSQTFCSDHYKYSQHNCASPKIENYQVPVCPLCSKPVSTPRGMLPDIAVNQHIEKFCTPTTNFPSHKCSYATCKQRGPVPIKCQECGKNFCLRHRHATDHNCNRNANTIKKPILDASIANSASSAGTSLTEDEILAQTLALSILEQDQALSQNHNQRANTRETVATNGKNKCYLS